MEPYLQSEALGSDTREEYIIHCTYPHPRNKQTFRDNKYVQCGEARFYVKWNPQTSTAKVLCSQCRNELFTHTLNMTPPLGEQTPEVKDDGITRNTDTMPTNSDPISDSDGSNAHSSSEETNEDTRNIIDRS